MRTLGIHGQYKIRVCKNMRAAENIRGSNDTIGSYVRYIHDNRIFDLAHNFDFAHSVYLECEDILLRKHSTLSDFESVVPFAVSTK